MEIQINWIAVVIATAIGTIVAGIGYQEPVFGKVWRKLTGVTAKLINSLYQFVLF